MKTATPSNNGATLKIFVTLDTPGMRLRRLMIVGGLPTAMPPNMIKSVPDTCRYAI